MNIVEFYKDRPGKTHMSSQQKNRSYVCWIIDQNLDVVKVRATFTAKDCCWTYKGINGRSLSKTCTPYHPSILGSSTSHNGGFGHHYKTKKVAVEDQKNLIEREIKMIKERYMKIAQEEIDNLQKKL